MSKFYPQPMQSLIQFFTTFPGIGEKTAQRFVFHLLRMSPQDIATYAQSLLQLHTAVGVCSSCKNYSEKSLCAICANSSRDKTIICIVGWSHELLALERTSEYNGLYHVLGGYLNILEGITPEKLNIKELIDRIHLMPDLKEIILAFNPDLEGESTSLYISKLLKAYHIKITRLARGLPRGSTIEYADEITLGDSIKSRREI